jgi:hypothetical protein
MTNARSTLFIVLSPTGIDTDPLLSQLQAHPDVLCHAGMQGPLSEAGFAGLDDKTLKAARGSKELAAFKQGFPEAFLYKYVLDSRGRQAVGFAVDHGSLLDPVNARMRTVLHQDSDVHVLLYAPKNTLRAYAEDAQRRQTPPRAQVEIEPQKFLLHAKQIDRLNAYVEKFFQGHAQLKIDSADLLPSRAGATLKAVAKFLDMAPFRAAASPLKEPQAELRGMIANFPAMEAALRDTPYSQMLGS